MMRFLISVSFFRLSLVPALIATSILLAIPAHSLAGGLLTSGQSAPYLLPAVTSNILFSGEFSYQIVVPSGAARLDVQLRTTTPGVDVDLYVRIGQDVALSGTQVVADFKAEGLTGGENISITTPSAGTYYIGFGLFTFGTPVSGTITATVTTTGDTPPPATPTLPPNSVVNGASFRPATELGGALAPGSIVAIFGSNLADDLQLATSVPLPTTLGNTSVTFNGISAPLFFVASTQINAQVPFDALPGEVSVHIKRGSETSAAQTVSVAAVSPGIFALNQQGTGQGAILIANTAIFAAPSGSISGKEARPANRLEFISIFAAGLGDVTNRPPNGEPPSGGGLSVTLETPTATIGGVEVPVSFSGLTSFVGLYQVNVQVPSNAPGGNAVEVVLTIGGVPSNTVTIAVNAPANQAPTAVASATPTSGIAPLAVQFTGSGSFDPDGTIASYAWDFGDGNTSTLADPSRIFQSSGTFTATLTVTDNGGLIGTASVIIEVSLFGISDFGISDLCAALEGALIFADDGTFLGRISSDTIATDSIGNTFGPYGSEFSPTSIYNEFGTYGSQFSSLSPFNEFASSPPIIYIDDIAVAFLTVNQFKTPRVDPRELFLCISGISVSCAALEGALIFADDGTFLGRITSDTFATDSIGNTFGPYGSEFSPTSIYNEFGTYGSQFSSLSPFNEFASSPPIIYIGDIAVAFLTVNQFKTPRVDPRALFPCI